MTHICISTLTIIVSDNGFVACSAARHYLNQWWNIINWTPANKFQWNFNQNSYIFIQENPFENAIRKMVAILSWPQCVKKIRCACHTPISSEGTKTWHSNTDMIWKLVKTINHHIKQFMKALISIIMETHLFHTQPSLYQSKQNLI